MQHKKFILCIKEAYSLRLGSVGHWEPRAVKKWLWEQWFAFRRKRFTQVNTASQTGGGEEVFVNVIQAETRKLVAYTPRDYCSS